MPSGRIKCGRMEQNCLEGKKDNLQRKQKIWTGKQMQRVYAKIESIKWHDPLLNWNAFLPV